MGNYVALSLETHLFFARIMKEHSLFLEAGFPCADKEWIERADYFRKEFEELLAEVVNLSDKRVTRPVLTSCELTTEFTIAAEEKTACLSGVPINSEITRKTQELCSIQDRVQTRYLTRSDYDNKLREVHRLNQRACSLLDGLIQLKEDILKEVSRGKLFTVNYPLLVQHILREAKLYRATVWQLMNGEVPSYNNMRKTEDFWNRIMMEHALFIRGLLDPTEEKLIETADCFAQEYKKLLEGTNRRVTEQSLEETLKYRDFKAAGAEGILECKIASIILPLLADHVLREANHYLRLLESDCRTFQRDGYKRR